MQKTYSRQCKKCNKKLNYSSSCSYYRARKKNSDCKECSISTEEYKRKASEFSKRYWQTAKIRTVYEHWLNKYGKKEADKRQQNYKIKQSLNSSGKNNPMYGKLSPQGSGNGWSGWYKNWYFRSLKELSYFIKIIERFKLQYENGELNKFKINYKDYKGVNRTYHPDFIIANKYVIEIKPKRLWNSDLIKRKKQAAEKWCKNNGYIYKLRDTKIIDLQKIEKLNTTGLLKFIDRYEKKFKQLCINKKI